MTQENYKYRTNPLFLRNQFLGKDTFRMPVIPKAVLSDEESDGLRLIGFDLAKKEDYALFPHGSFLFVRLQI